MSVIFTQDQLRDLHQGGALSDNILERLCSELRHKGIIQVALQEEEIGIIDQAYQDVQDFFALDCSIKSQFQRVSMDGHLVSYSTEEQSIYGIREAIDVVHLEQKSRGVAINESLSGFWTVDNSPFLAVKSIMGGIVQNILHGIGTYLPEGYSSITQYKGQLGEKMRGLFYQEGDEMEKHMDRDLLTVLHARQSGIRVNYKERDSVNENTLTVIVGKQLEQISESFFWATEHEVKATCKRQSLAYFYGISEVPPRGYS